MKQKTGQPERMTNRGVRIPEGLWCQLVLRARKLSQQNPLRPRVSPSDLIRQLLAQGLETLNHKQN